MQSSRGFQRPTTTPVPDELFDIWLTELSHAELRTLFYIIRRTLGFKRETDNISLKQMLDGLVSRNGDRLDKGVGLSKPHLLRALRSLQEHGLITHVRNR